MLIIAQLERKRLKGSIGGHCLLRKMSAIHSMNIHTPAS